MLSSSSFNLDLNLCHEFSTQIYKDSTNSLSSFHQSSSSVRDNQDTDFFMLPLYLSLKEKRIQQRNNKTTRTIMPASCRSVLLKTYTKHQYLTTYLRRFLTLKTNLSEKQIIQWWRNHKKRKIIISPSEIYDIIR